MNLHFTTSDKQFLHGQKDGQWSTMVDLNTAQHEQKTAAGLTFEVYKDQHQGGGVYTAKWNAVKQALEALRKSGMLWTQAELESFTVIFYGDRNNAGESRGVVYFETPTSVKPKAVLQLGARSVQHVTVTLNKGADGGGGHIVDIAGGMARPARTVADRFFDYYKTAKTVNQNERCILAQAFHEFGHIFHQLLAPNQFHLHGEIAQGRSGGSQSSFLPAAKARGTQHVSQYSGEQLGGAQPRYLNEYVAEVFCGMMMGVHWDKVSPDVMKTYRDLAGPAVPAVPEEISRLTDFVAQTCVCPGGQSTKVQMYN